MQELGEDVGGSGGDGWWSDGGRAEQACAVEAREDLFTGAEEYAEAEGEEVWGVAGRGEDVMGNLEVAVANLDEDFRGEELGYQTWYFVAD